MIAFFAYYILSLAMCILYYLVTNKVLRLGDLIVSFLFAMFLGPAYAFLLVKSNYQTIKKKIDEIDWKKPLIQLDKEE